MPASYIVYADVLFVINFALDFLILWTTAKFGHFTTTRLRLVMGASLGAFYGVLVIYPSLSVFYSISIKLLFSLFVVALTFPGLTIRKFLQATSFFYLISFAMAGAMLGGSSILSQNATVFAGVDVKTSGLFLAGIVALILSFWGIRHLKKNWRTSQFRIPVQVFLGSRSLVVEALIDTGNDLRDPISHQPVMIVEYQAIKEIIPSDFRTQFERYSSSDTTKILERLEESALMPRIRLIPFSSIGKHHGMLIGFKPDMLVILGKKRICTKDVVVCLYHKSLSSAGSYRAVLNPEVLEIAV